MQGRIANDIKIETAISEMLKELPDFVNEWYHNLRASSKQMSTCRDFLTKIRKFLLYINTDIKHIQPNDITYNITAEYFISIQTKKKDNIISYTSDSYQQGIWSCLNNFMKFLVKRNYISENHMELISKPKNKDLDRINKDRILLTKYDFNDIIAAIKNGVGTEKAKSFQTHTRERDLAIMLIFMNTGMRKSALSSIDIDDINFNQNTLSIIDKGEKIHIYYLNSKTMAAITDWIAIRRTINSSSNALFITKEGNRLSGNAIYKLVDKYCEDALGYHISPHKLRAGFCSILYKETGNLEFVRRAVGHSNIQTTQRYIVTENNEREVASDIINSIIGES